MVDFKRLNNCVCVLVLVESAVPKLVTPAICIELFLTTNIKIHSIHLVWTNVFSCFSIYVLNSVTPSGSCTFRRAQFEIPK
jgi:hypothetical protein